LSDAREEYRGIAAKLQVADLIDIEPYLTESQLQYMYRRARAVFVPSLMEGFGIPVLEAMASGTPVIASNTTSLPEVGGRAAAYFNPRDTNEMAAVLSQVLGDPARQQHMIEQGFVQAGQFHPDIVGARIQRFWDDLAEGNYLPRPAGHESPESITIAAELHQDAQFFVTPSGSQG
jgi:glycosyltransferase involved in cell wall biosynthesis